MKRVYVVGTADTKGEELAYLAGLVAARGAAVARVDVGTRAPARSSVSTIGAGPSRRWARPSPRS
jgi:uncharacterized protein (UPF0261 family)